jgi:muramoyltetrapeptide carboxypeptidase
MLRCWLRIVDVVMLHDIGYYRDMNAPLIWPRSLKSANSGGTVGLCSPSGPCPSGTVQRAVTALEARGRRVIVAPHTEGRCEELNYLAGTDAQRAEGVNYLLRHPEVDAILCTRGGYGAGRILDRLDYAALRNAPRPFIGYSDITALSLAFAAQSGVISFSGIMATGKTDIGGESPDPYSEESLWFIIGEGDFPRTLASPEDSVWTIHRRGEGVSRISGHLYPVCLSLLISLLGTPYMPDLTGAALVIEDVGESLYRIDRMLTQLRLSGVLNRVSAVLVGTFNGTNEDNTIQESLPQMVMDMTPQSVTVVSGVAYGHIARRFTLPVGAMADINILEGTFTFRGNSPS